MLARSRERCGIEVTSQCAIVHKPDDLLAIGIEGGERVAALTQFLPPGTVFLLTVQQPRHLAGGELLGGFLLGSGGVAVVADAIDAAIYALEPVAVGDGGVAVGVNLVPPAYAAHINFKIVVSVAGHVAGAITVGDDGGAAVGGIVIPAHAAGSATRHVAGAVTAGDGATVVTSTHAAGSAGLHVAGAVTVCNGAQVLPAHAAGIAVPIRHVAGVVTVGNRASVLPTHATQSALPTGYGVGVVAVGDGARAKVPSAHTASTNVTIAVAEHVAGAVTAGDGAIVPPAHAANINISAG